MHCAWLHACSSHINLYINDLIYIRKLFIALAARSKLFLIGGNQLCSSGTVVEHNSQPYDRGFESPHRHGERKRREKSYLAAMVLSSSSLTARRTSALCLSTDTLRMVDRSCKIFRRSFVKSPWAQCYKTFYGRNLRMLVTKINVCPRQAFLD